MRNGGWKSRLPYHDVWVRNREWGQRPALGSTNRLMKGLYSSLMPVNSWSHDGNPDIPQPGAIFNLEFSPDGSLLVAACEKKSFLMFDPLTRKMIISGANAHDDCVNCVRFLDSRIFATCSDDKTVALWDTRNLRNRLRTLQGHSNWVKNIEFSQKDGLLVTSGFDGAIYTWDINSYTECGFIYNRVFHTNGLMRTRLTPDGSKMIICTTGGYLIVIHDLDLNTLEQDLSGFKPNMYRLMQLSLTTIPVAANFTQLFSRRRKKNRVEFIADFPENDDAEVVSSLQVHPQGWCVLSRNISNHEKSEWTCIHDIQDDPVSDTEALELEDCSTDFEPSEVETNGNEPSQDGDRAVPSSVSALQALFQNVIDGSNVRDSSGRGRQAQTTEQESPRRNAEATVSSADVWEALIAIRFHRERERRNAANSQFDSSRMNIVRTFSGLQDLNVNSLLDNLMQRDTNNSETRSNNDSNSDDNENDNDNDDDSANNNPSERSNSSYIIFRYRYNQNSDNQEASTSSSTSNVSENADNGSSSRSSSEPVTRIRNSQIGNNYRLGNLHRTAYAQVPGLATVANPHITAPLQNPIPQQPMPVAQTPVMTDTSQYSVSPHSTPSPPASTSIMSPDAVDGGVASTLSSGFDSSYTSGFNSSSNNPTYRPVYHHWFFKREIEGKVVWYPLSMADSTALEAALCSSELNVDTKVPTDGGRYDVEILRRQRVAVFWKEEPTEVRRCSWFSKGPTESRQMPYEENIATLLEEEYKQAVLTNSWSRRVTLPNEDEIVIHSPTAIVHHSKNISFSNLATWDSNTPVQLQPKIVKRGLDEFNIAEGEPEKVDHLLFLVHGIGSFCDLKFRPVIEVVDDFRNISLQLTQSHFRGAIEQGIVNRIEVLPVSWHDVLHSQETGIDRKLQSITLQSIPKLRHFTNDTLLDILFYTSPIYCETIVQAVGNELNRLYSLYCSRNPHFRGGVSVGGHSLGSLILFDMLCNQLSIGHPLSSTETSEEHKNGHDSRKVGLGCLNSKDAVLSNDVSYVTIGRAGTGQPYIKYPQLSFQPAHFFGFGAPIGMFITIRGIASLGADFKFPTCPSFFNIFHPYDPVAYRIEPLIIPEMEKRHPVLIPHHKGRKRMHLQLRDTMAHVGAALKSTLMDSVRPVLNTVYQLAGYRGRPDEAAIEEQMTKALQEELTQEQEPSCAMHYDDDHLDESVRVGQLNGGRRIDYVLQEAPLESFNEYLFALSSHVCYWESEDTMLLVLKEIYSHMGVCVDNQIPQQMLPFDIPMSEAQSYSEGVPRYVSTMGPVSES